MGGTSSRRPTSTSRGTPLDQPQDWQEEAARRSARSLARADRAAERPLLARLSQGHHGPCMLPGGAAGQLSGATLTEQEGAPRAIGRSLRKGRARAVPLVRGARGVPHGRAAPRTPGAPPEGTTRRARPRPPRRPARQVVPPAVGAARNETCAAQEMGCEKRLQADADADLRSNTGQKSRAAQGGPGKPPRPGVGIQSGREGREEPTRAEPLAWPSLRARPARPVPPHAAAADPNASASRPASQRRVSGAADSR